MVITHALNDVLVLFTNHCYVPLSFKKSSIRSSRKVEKTFFLRCPGNEKEMRIHTTSINLSVSVTICVRTSQNITVPHLLTTLSWREWFVCQ